MLLEVVTNLSSPTMVIEWNGISIAMQFTHHVEMVITQSHYQFSILTIEVNELYRSTMFSTLKTDVQSDRRPVIVHRNYL
jgi:hypothetical protein